MIFLETNDGHVGRDYIISIGKAEAWPHGLFHKITYRVGSEAWETHAREEDVDEFLSEDI